jgi:hypothetical protein
MRVLPDGRLGLEECAQGLAVGGRGILPIGPDRGPTLTQPLLIGIAVLGDDRGDPVGVLHREPEAGRCAVVKDIDSITVEPDDFGEPIDDTSKIIEGVRKLAVIRHV